MRVKVAQDHIDALTIGTLLAARPDGRERVTRRLRLVDRPPQTIVADRAARVELPGAVGLVAARGQPLRFASLRPATPALRLDPKRPELVKGEDAVTVALQDLLDTRQLLLPQRVRRFPPGLGALEGNALLRQDLAQPSSANRDLSVPLGRQAALELTDAPAGERSAKRGRFSAALTMKARSSSPIRRVRPPAHRGSNDRIPISLNRWIISRTRSGEVWTKPAITVTELPAR